jgi:hypothetical protein
MQRQSIQAHPWRLDSIIPLWATEPSVPDTAQASEDLDHLHQNATQNQDMPKHATMKSDMGHL